MALDGRAPRVLADAPQPRGGAWNRDGVILFSGGPLEPLMRIPAEGGTAMPVSKVSELEGDRYPEFLPDRNHFLYMHATDAAGAEGIYVASLDGRTAPKRLIEEPGNVAFVPGDAGVGHLLYRSQGGLVARAFDTRTLELTGSLQPVTDLVSQGFGNIFWSNFSAGSAGLVYSRGPRQETADIVWRDASGTRTPIGEGVNGGVALSPDGGRLAFRKPGRGVDPDLWVTELMTGRSYRAATSVTSAVWSPDGQELAFTSRTSVLTSVFRVRADGGSTPERLGPLGLNGSLYAWSPDGKWLLAGLQQASDIVLFSMEDGHTVSDYVTTPAVEAQASLSPDGKWVAYASNEGATDGERQIFVKPMPATSARYPVGFGAQPKWSKDGKWLFVAGRGPKGRALRAVPVNTARGFEAGAPRDVYAGAAGTNYEPAPDGRFIAVEERASGDDGLITVVLDWKP